MTFKRNGICFNIRLKRLQGELERSLEVYHGRSESLQKERKTYEALHETVERYPERKRMERKVELLEQKRDWALVSEQRSTCMVRS